MRDPTAAQAEAGNYRKARLALHGLPLVLENPHGSVRRGVSEDGTAWENRLAAHYGEIAGTLGADGDPIDVYVGPFPESRRVWVINQGWPDGAFDEHKVMLAFATEAMARDAYLASFDRGWTGLQSLVSLTLDQLKWWLRHGDHKRPLSLDQLPFDGSPAMNKTLWNADAQPLTPIHKLMYELRSEDAEAGLLLDAVTMPELMADPDIEVVAQLDALVVPVARMAQRMDLLQRVMDAAGGTVKVTGYTISDPIRARGVMQVAVLFALSDGQAVTIWFHNPDTTPAKIAPFDELISWKWMLNKKDITIVVAPERGRELNPREVARRIMRLAEKNSAAFQKANAKLAERMQTLEALDTEIQALEVRLGEVQEQIAEVRLRRDVGADDLAARERDVTTPEGYARIADDEAALHEWQDVLDDLFGRRLIEVRNALRRLGWEGENMGALSKRGVTLALNTSRAGAGRNIVALGFRLVQTEGGDQVGEKLSDDLTRTPEQIAAALDAMVPEVAPEPAEPEPMTPELYAAIMGDDAELAKHAPELDSLLTQRYKAVLDALIDLGWKSDLAGSVKLGAIGLGTSARMVEGTDVMVGLTYSLSLPGDAPDSDFQLRDTLKQAPSKMAEAIHLEAKSLIPAKTAEDDGADVVAEAVAAAKNGQITRLVTDKLGYFTFGDDIVLTDELRAKVEAALGESLVEHVFPGREGEVALVPASNVPKLEAEPSAEDRVADIREALRALGWAGDAGAPIGKGGHFAEPAMGLVGKDGVAAAPWTIKGVPGFFMSDTLERSAEDVAAAIDLGLTSYMAQREEQEREKAAAERSEAIARVDEAYQFDSATDAFKLLVARSVDEDDYSAFKSARVIDAAVKAAGGSVAWDVSAVGKLDSVDDEEDDTDVDAEWEATPADDPESVALDGDFPGHPFRGNQHKKASAESGAAVKASIRAKHHESKGNGKEAKKAHKSAALSHKAAAMHSTGKAKSYHAKMAKFHGSRAGAVLDDASGIADPVVEALAGFALGLISKDGQVIGRAVIAGGDGKAMIYAGAEGAERVKRVGGDYPFLFEEDDGEQQAMVEALFASAAPASAAEPEEFEHAGRRIYPGKVKVGDEISIRWAVETAENKARREAGEPTRGGDRLADSKESAMKIAEEMNADDEREARRQRELAEEEAKAKAAEEAWQAELADDDGFAESMTELRRAKARNDLLKQISYKGAQTSLKALVRKRVAAGAAVIEAEGQRALTVSAEDDGYLLQRQLGKTALDYAEFLIAKRDAAKAAGADNETTTDGEQVTPTDEPTANDNPELAADRAYLQSLVDGSGDLLAEDTFQRLEPMFTKYDDNADMKALLEKAADAYGNAVMAEAQKALAEA